MSPDTLFLAGKTALVTGSGKENGIGAAIARALARQGASVAIHYVSEGSKGPAEKVATDIRKEFGTKTTVVQGWVENYDTAKNMVEQILKAFSVDHIDILEAQLQYEFAVNVFGVIYMTQAVIGLGRMPKDGRIINIGTIASKILVPPPVYGATEAAADALTTLWAGELDKSSIITVNTLAPGPVPTDISKGILDNPDGSPTALQLTMYDQTRAANRLGSPEDLADATLLLVSEKSRWITAQFISELPESAARTFIYTGNCLDVSPILPLTDAGVGKSATAHLIHCASEAFKDQGFKFYYADERNADGSPAYSKVNGPAHGKFYAELAEGTEQGPWQQTFVKGVGYTLVSAKI
ncbi:putative Short-chain dehydrogenase [Seiridium unicorne]|uniref:Short-chain dehydrogenase n=1 Tax=Seiridium unicorne TaxID=138068 RepID=A0ABR2UEC3_9PEZI